MEYKKDYEKINNSENLKKIIKNLDEHIKDLEEYIFLLEEKIDKYDNEIEYFLEIKYNKNFKDIKNKIRQNDNEITIAIY